jgi:uncharacterized protein YjiK
MIRLEHFLILKIILCLSALQNVVAQAKSDTVLNGLEPFVVKVSRVWQLPAEFKEISGIAYIDADRLACVQDETGTIFIYNLTERSIEQTIPFGPPGDYEGITTVNGDAYVACADGRIIEILNYRTGKPVVKEYGTHLTVKQNVEGICYDKKNGRLLVSIKGQEPGAPLYKGVYEFDLSLKKMQVKPAFKIDLSDQVFGRNKIKNPQTIIQPSDIDIHPVSRDLYITDGVRSQLLILGSAGKIKALYALDKSEVVQPEGMCFTPSGELYIASPGKREEASKLLLLQFP